MAWCVAFGTDFLKGVLPDQLSEIRVRTSLKLLYLERSVLESEGSMVLFHSTYCAGNASFLNFFFFSSSIKSYFKLFSTVIRNHAGF